MRSSWGGKRGGEKEGERLINHHQYITRKGKKTIT
jgi:hypothetical protein